MAAYADYTYYTGTFGGVAIASDAFDGYALRASREVDKMTRYGIQSDDNPNGYVVDNKVKNAVCAVADVLFRMDNGPMANGVGIASESVESHSVSYSTLSPDALAEYWRSQLWFAGWEYLTGSGLLYRGVGRCHR